MRIAGFVLSNDIVEVMHTIKSKNSFLALCVAYDQYQIKIFADIQLVMWCQLTTVGAEYNQLARISVIFERQVASSI